VRKYQKKFFVRKYQKKFFCEKMAKKNFEILAEVFPSAKIFFS
jgi:hypothetical protein